jgi:hypothetical protein
MDHHVVAAISITGVCLDVLGGLYLAYDLLGGKFGPLRLLTRMVTYSIVFGVGYGVGLNFFFGVASGIATGITVAIELQRTGHRQDHYPFPVEVLFSAIRGVAFGAGLYRFFGFQYAAAFAILMTLGQAFAYARGMRPGVDYSASRKPRFSRRQLEGTIVRTVGFIAAALLCSALVSHVDHPWRLALRLGLVTGVVTAVGTMVNPYIEYFADNLPERRLGVFGILLLLCGSACQSIQYLVSILDIPVM